MNNVGEAPTVARTITLVSMPKAKLSVDEIKAVAETAITTRYAADAAQTALATNPEDQTLKDAYAIAEQVATQAKQKADALSQQGGLTPQQIAKKKRKIAIIQNDLRQAGVSTGTATTDDDDDDDDADDDDQPLTRGDLKRMRAEEAQQTAVQMAESIADTAAKQAVVAALNDVVPSGNAEEDFKKAVAIANIDRNNKILEEMARKPTVVFHRAGAGAPPPQAEGAFEPTADEARFMRPPFSLTKEQIIATRPK